MVAPAAGVSTFLLIISLAAASSSSASSAFVRPSSYPIIPNAASVPKKKRAEVAVIVATRMSSSSSSSSAPSSTSPSNLDKSRLYVPSERDAHYGGDIARYLLDLDDEGATFNFCGGMMFQLSLSERLRSHLEEVSSSSSSSPQQQQQQQRQRQQPVIHPSSQSLMNRTPGYEKSSRADNAYIFHGRELRGVPKANGGMGFVLQLGYADPTGKTTTTATTTTTTTAGTTSDDDAAAGGVGVPTTRSGKGADSAWDGTPADPQGWTSEEISTYDGWRSDRVRKWRDSKTYVAEGFVDFAETYGGDGAHGLNHRFFLHYDDGGRMWLCAEDGCEGTPSSVGGGGACWGRSAGCCSVKISRATREEKYEYILRSGGGE